MSSLKTILVVDDNAVNRTILSKILSEEYAVMQAENGQVALELLHRHTEEIAAIMLDIVMPVMDGYAVLEIIGKDVRYRNLPIIVTTENSDSNNEIKVLSLGAWDFVSKPYQPQIIKFRLKNAIDKSQLTALKRLKYLAEYDSLTGLYNKTKFFYETHKMLTTNPEERFVFLRFDVDRFQLINSFFGIAEGDKLLVYIAERMADDAKKCDKAVYGRIESDIFGVCMPYNKNEAEAMIISSKKTLAKFNPNYDIVPSVGLYVIEDDTISVEEMYNRATLATKKCKGNYVDFYAYYDESMSVALAREQEMINEMNFALENGQFVVYLQPKYDLRTNAPYGAEALVRWAHPQKGMLSPGEFIPIFERNGFIRKLDYYVWEQACQLLHKWMLNGDKLYPISVNVSRVNVYDPQLAETLLELVNRYEINPAFLNLELTESAYTDNPVMMKKTMTQLQNYGFVIMMDDFGSGYSSLSLLKDIAIDFLKIDMGFLAHSEVPGRGENIIASVIRMAKWLNIPVIAEGAETVTQVEFLRSVGCDYVQGYYFAKPMPIELYEELCGRQLEKKIGNGWKNTDSQYEDLFSLNQELKHLFNNALQAVVMYEFVEDHIEMIRVNEAYYMLMGQDDMVVNTPYILRVVDESYREDLLSAFRTCVKTRGMAECEYIRNRNETSMWVYIKLSYITTIGGKHIIIGELTDITMRKEIDAELQRYRSSLLANVHDAHTILIVDDVSVNRMI
ncbi:MAG: EAL domain-containing protein, partial [Lachnospiraceae bacterium]